MKTTIEEPKTWLKEIYVEVPIESIQEAYNKKLSKYKKEIQIPGFRPGKVPMSMVQNRFGSSIKYEVVEDLINSTYRNVITENKIIPVSHPKFSDVNYKENEPLSYKVSVEVDPVIEIKGYKNLNFPLDIKPISESSIDDVISDILNRFSTFEDVDHESIIGDFITFEFLEISINGVPKDNFQTPNYPLEVGKSQIEDLDSNLIGISRGEEKRFIVNFNPDYNDAELAGKSVEYHLKVKAVQKKILPELNEEFLKKLGDFSNESQLRDQIRKDLEAREYKQAKEVAQETAIDEIIAKNDFEVPPARVEYYIDKVLEEEQKYYSKSTPPKREEIDSRFREIGIRAIKRLRILQYIAQIEKVKASQEEVDEKIRLMALSYQKPFEELKATLRRNGTTLQLRESIQEEKVLDSLIGLLPWESKEQ